MHPLRKRTVNTDKLNTLFTIEDRRDRRRDRRDRHVYMRIHPECPRHPSIYLSLQPVSLQPASQPAIYLSLPSAVHPFIVACTSQSPSSLPSTPRARSSGVDGGAWEEASYIQTQLGTLLLRILRLCPLRRCLLGDFCEGLQFVLDTSLRDIDTYETRCV